VLVLSGMLIMAWNVWKTFQMARDEVPETPVLKPAHA
jgi:cbb3-type cytochrome oxidase subunit 1